MIIRIECFSHIIHIEFAKQITEYEVSETDPAPENTSHPMHVYSDEPADPVANRLGFYFQG